MALRKSRTSLNIKDKHTMKKEVTIATLGILLAISAPMIYHFTANAVVFALAPVGFFTTVSQMRLRG